MCQSFDRGISISSGIQDLVSQPLSQDFAVIADAFVELQEARHAADYGPSDFFTRPDVPAMIALVDQAFIVWRAVKDTPNASLSLVAIREEMALSCLMVAGSVIEVSRAAFDDRPPSR